MWPFKPMKEDLTSSRDKEEIINMAKQESKKELDFPNPPKDNKTLELLKGNREPEPMQQEEPNAVVYSDQAILSNQEVIIKNQMIIYNAITKIAKAANIKLEE